MRNEQTVRDVYAAFQRGDVAAILNVVTDNVQWRNDMVASAECPWNGNFSTKAGLPGFFVSLAECLEFSVFDIRSVVESGTMVAVLLRIESTVRRTGRPLKNDVIHLWTFSDAGLISGYRHFNDTAAELAAWRS